MKVGNVRSLAATAMLAVACTSVAVLPAHAHKGGDSSRSAAGFTVSRDAAIASARAEGMAEIREVKARRGVWKIEGFDAAGYKLEVSVDGYSGHVVKVETYGARGPQSSQR